MISLNQMRAARALLDLSQEEVAHAIHVATNTFSKIENGKSGISVEHMRDIQRFYESHGVEFIPGDGVRKRQGLIVEYNGAEGFRSFMDDVYETVKVQGGLICIHNVRPDNWIKWLGKEWNTFHTERMLKIRKSFEFRITIKQGDHNFLGKHAEYRWLPERSWNDQTFYAYGDRLALMLFEPEAINIRVIHSKRFSAGFRSLFSLAWEHIPPIPPKEVSDAK